MKNCGAGIAVGQGTGRDGMGGTPGTIKALVAVMTVCDCMGCSWFMWRNQLGCCSCDGGLQLCMLQLIHVEGSVGPAERFDCMVMPV